MFVEESEDPSDRSNEVEVDHRSPCVAFFLPGVGGIGQLERLDRRRLAGFLVEIEG